jgi:hypothetical protein
VEIKESSELKDGILLKSQARGRVVQLLRVVWVRDYSPAAYVLDVSGPIPGGSRMPQYRAVVDLNHFLSTNQFKVAEEDSVRTSEMSLPDSELPASQLKSRDEKYALIREIVESDEFLCRVLSKSARGAFLRTMAKEKGVAPSRLYKLLTVFWWFGGDKNSLLDRFSMQGGKGVSKTPGEPKRGRRNATVLLEGKTTPYKGVNVEQRDLNRFTKALDIYYVGKNYTLADTYEEMSRHLYVGWNRDDHGKTVRHPVDPLCIPTLGQFKYHARRIRQAHHMDEKKAGALEWSQNIASRTGSAGDIALGPTDVYDMDVGVLKCIAVTDNDVPEEIGNVSVCFAIDRASTAIVGFHDYVGAESWERYRFALFWAFTSTSEHLTLLGLPELAKDADEFGAFGWCNEVYVDRGPGRGNDAFYAIVDRLKLGRALAPARRGDMKAVVESVIGYFQRKVATLPGGHSRKKGIRNKEQAEDAKNMARLTVARIREFLVAAIAEHNQFHAVPHLLTRDMVRDGVKPVPVAIYRWGQRNVRGPTVQKLNRSELYLRLLPSKTVALTSTGIRHKNARFSSPVLVQFRHRNIEKKHLKVTISWDEVDPKRRYWRMPSGALGVLDMILRDAEKLGEMSFAEMQDLHLRERAFLRKNDVQKRRKGYVSKAQEKILAKHAGVSPPKRKSQTPLLTPTQNKTVEAMRQKEFLKTISQQTLAPLEAQTEMTPTSKVQPQMTADTDVPSPKNSPPESAARANFKRHFLNKS